MRNNWDDDSDDIHHRNSDSDSYNGYDNDQSYSVWCDYLHEFIEFDSVIMPDNVELFNITAIAEYFNQDNKELKLWFEDNVDILQIIDSVTTGCDVIKMPRLIDISEKTMNKIMNNWYVNENVLIEYLRVIDIRFMHELVSQLSYYRVVNSQEDIPSPILTEDESE